MSTYTFTFTGKAGDGNALSLAVAFDYTGSGTISTDGIIEGRIGPVKWKYDIDDLLLVPGQIDIELVDKDGNLENWFLDECGGTIVSDRIPKITITYNGSTDYVGYMLPETLEINSDKTIKFKVSPRIDVLNEFMVYDASGTSNMSSAPFNYSNSSPNNWNKIVEYIEDIYQYVNSSISIAGGEIVIDHDWTYLGYRTSDNAEHTFTDFADLYQDTNQLWFDNTQGIETLGDALRKIASDWGAFTGMLHEEKAFFRKFYYYDSGNTQALTNVLKHKKTYFDPISYVTVTSDYDSDTRGTYTVMAGKYLEFTTIPFFDLARSHSNICGSYGGDTYYLRGAKDTTVYPTSNLDYCELLARYWLYARGNIARSRVDEFECAGLGYDFLKSTTYDSKKYQILEMEKDYEKCLTKIKALYMGTV